MARTIELFDVFLGSTSEVAQIRKEIRDRLESVEYRRFAKAAGYQIDVSEGQDVAPQISAYGQRAINEAVVNGADLAIVVLGSRLGTPTPVAESGSAEEARAIIERWRRGEQCQLFLCFDQRIDASTLDPDEFKRLMEFKKNVQGMGVLTHDFRDTEDICDRIGIWTHEYFSDLGSSSGGSKTSGSGDSSASHGDAGRDRPELEKEKPEFDEKGLIEVEDEMAAQSEALADQMNSVVSLIVNLASDIQNLSPNINSAVLDQDERSLRNILKELSVKFGTFSIEMNIRVDELHRGYVRNIEWLKVLSTFSDHPDYEALEDEMKLIPQSALGSMAEIQELRLVISNLPRLSAEFNSKKRAAAESLDRLIETTLQFAADIDSMFLSKK